jgi:hypothetical protein
MTLDELMAREAIRRTMAAYNIFLDRARIEEFLEVFTEDAILEFDARGQGPGFRNEGREAIRRWVTGAGGPTNRPQRKVAPTFVRHNLTTSLIQMTGPDAAKARTYWHVYTQIGPDHCGVYTDVYRKTGDDWLIAERRITLDWRAEGSLFGA